LWFGIKVNKTADSYCRSEAKKEVFSLGVVYVGDRATGKTSLATELINPKSDYVKISNQSYQNLKQLLKPTDIDPTKVTTDRFLEIEVKLPAGPKTIGVEWIDTPGEIWRKSWQQENPQLWQQVLSSIQNSEGILLILPPYREMPGLKPEVDLENLPNRDQWCNRLQRWIDFFCLDCPKARHIAICLNKADLFCQVEKEALELAYHPERSRKNWHQRNTYVRERYFKPVLTQIDQMVGQRSGLPVRCFITTIYNRALLELPWLYLASHLA